jgi:hypothetical protein
MEYIVLQSFTNYIDAHIIAGRLEEEGINCWLKDENSVTVNPLWTNALGGIKIMVAKEQQADALKLLEAYEMEKRAAMKCPKCGSSAIEFISSPRNAKNWVSSIVFFFLGSLALPAEKTWHCFTCEAEFDEPAMASAEPNLETSGE